MSEHSPADQRQQFLLHMYDQMWRNIDSHILVVWESIGTLVATIALFSLVEKGIISTEIASSLLILMAGWHLAHVYDAWEWFYRNLLILTNIEKQFLLPTDAKDIHCFFRVHRKPGAMITHLKIQRNLGIGVFCLVLIYHFVDRVVPGFTAPAENFDLLRCLPYLFAVIVLVYLIRLHHKVNSANTALQRDCPGISIEDAKMHQSLP